MNETIEKISKLLKERVPNKTWQPKVLAKEIYDMVIKDGTLVELPCKVGDTIYWLTSNYEIVDAVVSRIRINKYGVVFDVFEGGCEYSMFNTEFFKTKAEAEQKLKELENERD